MFTKNADLVLDVFDSINQEFNLDEKTKIELQFNIKSFALRPIYQDLKSRSFSIESEIEVRADVYQTKKIDINIIYIDKSIIFTF